MTADDKHHDHQGVDDHEMGDSPPSHDPDNVDLLTVAEFARASGYSSKTVIAHMKDRRISYYQLQGKTRRIPHSELVRYLETAKVAEKPDDDHLTVAEVGEALNVSHYYVYALIHTNALDSSKGARSHFIPRAEVTRLLAESYHPAIR
ncbi:helix-turn-helix domain-containing protein [Nonomuraea sp. NPDC050394]|uniref:helix-turn-helix domain-containing protein n=1 Tax=Nonomuraea sp. NPDC050394 TaxID=3364363 RepID=UPI0037939281